jgi:3-deoxy-7-phosphoheptulonate synthase
MIVVVREGASTGERAEIAQLLANMSGAGAALKEVTWGTNILFCLPDGTATDFEVERLLRLPAVERMELIATPYQLASRAFQARKTTVPVGNLQIGGGEPIIMAGPCSVESEAQIMAAAHAAREAGSHMLRGGAFKPRTSPYTFQGLGLPGVQLLARAGTAVGLPIVTEVMEPQLVPAVAELADVLQVGSRNMQNFPLLRAVGQSRRPVLLKRGFASTIEEWLLAAEYILAEGNRHVILCERGVRSFDPGTRNILDLTCVPLLATLTHLPVVIDPSHATGRRELVLPMSVAAIAAGADGLLIEMHPHPDEAYSDGEQSITPTMLCELVNRATAVHSVLSGTGGGTSMSGAGGKQPTFLQSGALVASAG